MCFNFGREGLGVKDVLNWAPYAKGVVPKGATYRNLRESKLRNLNATIQDTISALNPAKEHHQGHIPTM